MKHEEKDLKINEAEAITDNEIIAQFMGWRQGHRTKTWFPNERMNFHEHNDFNANQLKFHSSWDWLMPVVEKIALIGVTEVSIFMDEDSTACSIFGVHESPPYIRHPQETTLIDCTYRSVVDFIKWYNETQSGRG